MDTCPEGYYIGLMTGTSMDAVDTVLVDIKHGQTTRLVGSYEQPLPDEFRASINHVCDATQDSVDHVARLDLQLADLYAECIRSLLEQTAIKAEQVMAIGSHGQTIRHCPDCQPAYSVQIGNAARLVELTGITTVNNFRQRDMAAGGQGAPLAPLFHHHLFSQLDRTIVCINLGGIANISILRANGEIEGFDTGPANTLMDQWVMQQQQQRYDENAAWASSGTINQALLEKLLEEPWLKRPPPKSTGPELFNLQWLQPYLDDIDAGPADVQSTLCEFSAVTIANAIAGNASDAQAAVLCGGGAYNPLLVERIQHHLPNLPISDSSHSGIKPEWIEACMFGWLAYRALNGLTGNVPRVTGASHEVILGAIYPA